MESIAVNDEWTGRLMPVLKKTSLFASFGDEQIRNITTRAALLRLDPNDVLMREGEPPEGFFILIEGEIRVLLDPDGENQLELVRFGPGDILGIAGLLLEKPSTHTMGAVGPCTVLRLETRLFQAMVEKVPSFGLAVARTIAERLTWAVQRIPVPKAEPGLSPSDELLNLFPVEFMQRHRLLPLSMDEKALTVGFVDDPTPELAQRLRTHFPALEIRAVRIDGQQLTEVLRTHIGSSASEIGGQPPESAEPPAADPALFDRLLRAMVTEGASDLHLSAGQRPRWRIDGEMHEITDAPLLGPESVLDLINASLPQRNREEFAESNDTDFAIAVPGLARFRVNLFRDTGGAGAVLRLIPATILSLEQLGLPPVVGQFCTEPKGLVLVTGPTGSGKSTTLAAMIDLINRTRRDHIISIEDPVEFLHPSRQSLVNQREAGSHTTGFARALRAALREDPDVVLVGEMRDLETVSMALETANTGHLVFGTLHTATAITTVDRIIGLFPGDEQNRIRVMLADVLQGVISQNLLKRVGGGRVAALEILVVNYAVSAMIREAKTHQLTSTMQTGKAAGNRLLNDSLAELVREGTVTYDEALGKAVDKPDFARRFKQRIPA